MKKLLLSATVGLSLLSAPAMAGSLKGTIYKSPNCGCCMFHGEYLKSKNIKISYIENDTMLDTVKQKYNITGNNRACHTTEIAGYVVEGHVPYSAIQKLLNEKPNIAGIGIGGMPTFSPGMAEPDASNPSKLNVYALMKDGSTKSFGTFEYKGDKFFSEL
ncbi:MAG: DUF411 domain-containing protein [Alphaproteobacteria bacterium]